MRETLLFPQQEKGSSRKLFLQHESSTKLQTSRNKLQGSSSCPVRESVQRQSSFNCPSPPKSGELKPTRFFRAQGQAAACWSKQSPWRFLKDSILLNQTARGRGDGGRGGERKEDREGQKEEQRLVSVIALLESVDLQFKNNQVVFGNTQLKLFVGQMGKPRLQISAV